MDNNIWVGEVYLLLKKNKILTLLSIATLIYLISCFVYFSGSKNNQLENTANTSLKAQELNQIPAPKNTAAEAGDSESTQLGTTVDNKKEYLVIDDILFTMEKNLSKGGQVELKLTKSVGRNQYEVYIKKNVAK